MIDSAKLKGKKYFVNIFIERNKKVLYSVRYMKKLLLSLFVIFTFGFYVIYQRQIEPVKIPIAPLQTEVVPIAVPTPIPVVMITKRKYKDGTYTGSVADAYYGNVQVQAVIKGGKLVDVIFLEYPQDRETSININSQALPILKEEAIQAQSAKVDSVSGASATSPAFVESLKAALILAKN